MVTQRGMVNHLFAKVEALRLQPGERVAQTASPAFDISVWQLFVALLVGGQVCILPDKVVHDLDLLSTEVSKQGVTVLELVPSLLRAVLDDFRKPSGHRDDSTKHLPAAVPLNLHWMLVTGEACPTGLINRWGQCYPQIPLVNAYGPTECSDDVTHALLFPPTDMERSRHDLPYGLIGSPLANTQIYILDAQMQPVPIGVPGEISVGGLGVGRGYFSDPVRTALAFVPNPFVGLARGQALVRGEGERLYRTGDVGRYLDTGQIEFIGRIDQQVKLRGYRIELGEIEATLRAHSAVQEAIVVLREESATRKYLVAYVIAEGIEQERVLQTYLREHLPDSMVPMSMVFLPALPLSPNGKVDRKALPLPDSSQLDASTEMVAPQTPLQEQLALIWAEILQLPQVGIGHNFFALGGHSLLATQVVARIRQTLQVDLPLRSFFEAPTIAQLSHHLEGLLGAAPSPNAGVLVPKVRPGDLPLSFAQERLWFLDQLAPGSASYNLPMALRLEGKLQVSALEQSLATVVLRHEVLRTIFDSHLGRPVQVIKPALTLPVPVIDLSGMASAERDRQVSALARAEAERPFDLSLGPLVRVSLLRLVAQQTDDALPTAPQEHVFLLTLHHIVCDGWSIGVLVHEITTLYQAELNGEAIHLPPLPIQYADYTLWQRQWLQGDVLEEQMAYWRKQLANVSPLQLPTDHPRPAVKTDRGVLQSGLLPPTLSADLLRLCQQQEVTLFMVLLTAFQVLLMRYTGQMDISIGTPIANRGQAELEGLIGFFVNTLVMRIDLKGHLTFVEVLDRVREVCLGAYTHQDMPFEKVVEELEPERDLSRSPLFQVMFVLQNTPGEMQAGTVGTGQASTRKLTGITIDPLTIESTSSVFDLTLSLTETEQGLYYECEYSTDLFEADTIKRMLTNFQTLLEGVVQNPLARISDLPWLSETERRQILVEWNATTSSYPQEMTLHQLFEQQVVQTSDAIAVVFEESSLTYGELNRQANHLAHRLRRLGIGPDRLVEVCMERSLELAIALLAVLKAGGAYVPLDPGYPVERLTRMLRDTEPMVVLTQSHLRAALPTDPLLPTKPVSLICVDADWERIIQEPSCNLTSQVLPENLAYVIYTSGSTGSPKGVMNTHRGICNTLLWLQEIYPLTQDDSLLHKTSLSFDLSLEELFWPLVAGARLTIARPESSQESSYLVSLLDQYALTVLDVVPSVLQALISEGQYWSSCQTLRLVICGGETLSPELQEQFFASHRASLLNTYGPTEAAIDATFWSCQPESESRRVPIGRPIANTQIYLLDGQMQPVPIGVTGEVYIGGVNLARGYLKRADLTAERFVPHPFVGAEMGLVSVPAAGARLYRTGDLARSRPDGTLEFLGRIDNQVKLRGIRIELGEIEATLRAHPAVQEAVVILREESAARNYLVAYVVAEGIEQERVLQTYLREHLPNSMVPASMVFLPTLPLSASGKVERSALPLPDSSQLDACTEMIVPQTLLQEQLALIWAEVLHLPQVGIRHNFFALGGHSLLAVELLNRINRQFGPSELSLATLFQVPTIEQIAALLQRPVKPEESRTQATRISPCIPIQPAGEKHPFFCVHPHLGDVSCFLDLARHLHHDRPFYGIQAPGLVGAVPRADPDQILFSSIEEMATAYIDALLAVQPEGPYFLGGYCFGGLVAFEMARQLQAQGGSVALLVLLDSYPEDPGASAYTEVTRDYTQQPLSRMVELQDHYGRTQIAVSYEDLSPLQPDEQLVSVLDRLREVQIVPDDMDISQLRRYIQVYEAHSYCFQRYRPQLYSGRITILRSEDADADPSLWNPFSSEPVEVHPVSGDHVLMVAEPYVRSLAVQLQQCLDEADGV